MWRKIPLNYQLIVSLLGVHILAFSLAAEWLIRRNNATRMEELHHRLWIHADFVEDVIEIRDEALVLNPNSEIRRELDFDRNSYFLVIGADQQVIDESKGPAREVARQLTAEFERTQREPRRAFLAQIGDQRWLLRTEPVERQQRGRIYRALGHVAIMVEPVLMGLAQFERMVVSAAILLSLVSSLVSGLVISYSTRNFRRFAHMLRTSNPMRVRPKIDFKPLCSEEGLLHESYADMIDQVEKSAASQKLFIAHASHELKTPIATALMVTEIALSRDRSVAEYREAHNEVFEQLKILKRLSNTLLDVASLEEATVDYAETGSCDLAQVIEIVQQRWQSRADARGIRIERVNLESVEIPGHSVLWETVFSNLADNSIKYGKESGHLTFAMQKTRRGVEVIVRDDGVGMSAESLARMGEVFFKADPARAKVGSFGLGFAHARRIVDRLGGQLTITSQEGQGTTVAVTIKSIGAIDKE